jgi:hypothetical protein
MRALVAAIALALLAGGCASPRPATYDHGGETSYNRRELEPRQGLFTGSDGEWTLYRNDEPPPPPKPPPSPKPAATDVPRERSTLLCSPGYACDPPAGAK